VTEGHESGIEAAVEALLFLSSEAVDVARLAEALEVTPEEVEEALGSLSRSLESSERGVVLREVAGGYALASKPEYDDAARRLLAKPKTPPLSQAQAQVLAIVAYLQPI